MMSRLTRRSLLQALTVGAGSLAFGAGPLGRASIARAGGAAVSLLVLVQLGLWVHPLSDVVGAVLRAGLRLESFEEYPYLGWAMFPWMDLPATSNGMDTFRSMNCRSRTIRPAGLW